MLTLWGSGAGRLATVWSEKMSGVKCDAEVLRLNRRRNRSAQLAGRTPGAEASIQKAMADEHGQHVMELAKEYVGISGLLVGSGPPGQIDGAQTKGLPTDNNLKVRQFPDVSPFCYYVFVFSPALTLGGVTFFVQPNIVAEPVLGLPRDIHVESGRTSPASRAFGIAHRCTPVTP